MLSHRFFVEKRLDPAVEEGVPELVYSGVEECFLFGRRVDGDGLRGVVRITPEGIIAGVKILLSP